MSTLIERIDECRKDKGWSARQASLEAGMGVDFIRMIRNGKSVDPRRDNLDSLAEAFGCAYIWLATGKGSKDRFPTTENEREKRLVRNFRLMTADGQVVFEQMSDHLARSEKKTG